ncbi:MAG: maleylacetoacetate isomerase [Rhodobacteraceae bacterium]|nr:maleylacetoacetate isomerase [Paracoccaceae bacterium]
MSSLTLYDFWRSSASYRLRIALGLLGLDWSAIPVDLPSGVQRSPENMARNPQGLVPTLEIDGLSLTQSVAILEYLDETRGAGFLPGDALGRHRVRALSHAIAMEIHAVCNLRVASHAASASGGGITMASWMERFIPSGLDAVEAMLANGPEGPFCHGMQVSMADICLVPQIYNARRWDVWDTDRFPRIAAIMTALEEIPAVAAAHPDKHKPEG